MAVINRDLLPRPANKPGNGHTGVKRDHICEVGRPFVHANLRKTQKLTGGCMGIVMIRCPTTGRAISTRIAADQESFNATPVFYSQAFCARSAAPTTSGLQRKLGFTSLVSHPKKLPDKGSAPQTGFATPFTYR
jgi:hypothetical protein